MQIADTLERDGHFETANHLLRCLAEDTPIELGAADKRIVLVLLEDPPAGLEELRSALLRSL